MRPEDRDIPATTSRQAAMPTATMQNSILSKDYLQKFEQALANAARSAYELREVCERKRSSVTDEAVVNLGVHRDHSAGLEGVHRRRWGRCGGARLLHNHHREPLPRPATRQLILALVAAAIHVAIITQAHEAVVVLAPVNAPSK